MELTSSVTWRRLRLGSWAASWADNQLESLAPSKVAIVAMVSLAPIIGWTWTTSIRWIGLRRGTEDGTTVWTLLHVLGDLCGQAHELWVLLGRPLAHSWKTHGALAALHCWATWEALIHITQQFSCSNNASLSFWGVSRNCGHRAREVMPLEGCLWDGWPPALWHKTQL